MPLIFVSAVQIADLDHLRGYECGAVDYVSVPVVPEILRARVSVFVDLYRKTRELELLNAELEQRMRVVEQIVTDGGAQTAAQIEALREPRIDAPGRARSRSAEPQRSGTGD